MKILFISKFLPSHFQNILLYHTLSGNNEVHYISEYKHNDFNLKGVNYTNIRFPRMHFKGNKLQQTALRYVRRSQNFAKAMQRLKENGFTPDIIYTETSSAASLNIRDVFPDTPCIGLCDWYISNINELNTLDHDENSDLDLSIYLKINNLFYNEMLNNCTKLITFSHTQKASFPKTLQKKLSVIYHGINTNFLKPTNDKFSTPLLQKIKDKDIILYVTQVPILLPQYKNAVIAAKEVLAKNPNAAFALLSYDKKRGEENSDAFSFTKNLFEEFKDRTVFASGITRDEYRDALASSCMQLAINPTVSLNIGLFEALSTGSTLLAREDVAYFTEFVIPKQTGYLADFSQVSEIIKQMDYIIENKEERDTIRQKIRKISMTHFSIDAEIKKLLKLEASLLSKAEQ